jgi:hypothetical protein
VRVALILLCLLCACDGTASPPEESGCVEFDHATTRGGRPMTCRMLWCEKISISSNGSARAAGGVAALWCDG